MQASSTRAPTSPNDLGLTVVSAVSEVPAGTAVIITITLSVAIFLHRYLRRRYPCVTVVELTKAEGSLDDSFDDAVKNDYLCETEQDNINQMRLRLKHRAAEIRTQSIQAPASIWKKCIGIEVELFTTIIAWYGEVEALEREISASSSIPLVIVEAEKRYRYIIELGRRSMTAAIV
ncbi:40S ribosomal protein S6 [Paramarasmius palmivorus]|uniref:40S ribosomal protein S6 n=1 Tax=Paramarasmius palmivorus TaxID=297713 RepID=A0AAW0EF04_9AGAR